MPPKPFMPSGRNIYTRFPWRSICEDIWKELISVPSSGDETSCLIRFHNRTKWTIKVYWLNFRGESEDYGTMPPGASYNIDTHRNHIWFFKVVSDEDNSPESASKHRGLMRIAAVAEEYYKLYDDDDDAKTKAITRINKSKHNLDQLRPETSQHSQYIYGCRNLAHEDDHTRIRKNIYLIEPLTSLKIQCILKLNDGFDQGSQIAKEFVKQGIPEELRIDCFKHLATLWNLQSKLTIHSSLRV